MSGPHRVEASTWVARRRVAALGASSGDGSGRSVVTRCFVAGACKAQQHKRRAPEVEGRFAERAGEGTV